MDVWLSEFLKLIGELMIYYPGKEYMQIFSAFVVAFFIGTTIYLIVDRLIWYSANPVAVDMKEFQLDAVEFPTIEICNSMQYMLSKTNASSAESYLSDFIEILAKLTSTNKTVQSNTLIILKRFPAIAQKLRQLAKTVTDSKNVTLKRCGPNLTCMASHDAPDSWHGESALTWEPGYLDIHHISTGAGNAAFLILPDGTTFVIDAGEMGETFREAYVNKSLSYFTGGDMSGLQGYGMPEWYDTETPTTNAVGRVDVTTLNHHGNRDGTNINFVKNLQPQVVVQQAWCSDHPGQESFYRLVSKYLYSSGRKPDLFSIYMHDNVKLTYGQQLMNAYKSMYGHVVVRVVPGGGQFYVYVLDDQKAELSSSVKLEFGPYKSYA